MTGRGCAEEDRVTLEDDIAGIERQEQSLAFDRFDLDAAWRLGSLLRQMAHDGGLGVAIDVHLHSMPAFYVAMPGSNADHPGWIMRKRRLVLRFFQSSYGMGRKLALQKTTLDEKFGLSSVEYASHGGSFPINVTGVGCIGAVTVSGLPQRDDHAMVVDGLCRMLGRDYGELALT
jgi:uncharacterized protein (UPF0303 family)